MMSDKWLFRYDPYPKEGVEWNSTSRLLWIRNVLPNDPISTTSLYEIIVIATDESEARSKAIQFIESRRPATKPNFPEVIKYLYELTNDQWSLDATSITLSSPNVQGIRMHYPRNEDTNWKFYGVFNNHQFPKNTPVILVPITFNSLEVAQSIVSELLPKYHELFLELEEMDRRHRELQLLASQELQKIMDPVNPNYENNKSECYFSINSIHGRVTGAPSQITFEELTVPYSIAQDIMELVKNYSGV